MALALLLSCSPAVASLRGIEQLNGFETGGVADYAIDGPDGSVIVFFNPNARSGLYELFTSGAAGDVGYATTALSAASDLVSDGIWACVSQTPATPRRVRAWLLDGSPVVELVLNANRTVTLLADDQAIGTTTTAVVLCGAGYTHLEMRYQGSPGSGAIGLRINGAQQVQSVRPLPNFINETHIGPDDFGASSASLRWDDHTIAPEATYQGELAIRGLMPNRDGAFADWVPQGSCGSGGDFDCLDERPPDGDLSTVQSASFTARSSYCHQTIGEAGVYGEMLALKTILVGRSPLGSDLALNLRLNSSACGGNGGAEASASLTLPISFGAVARIDETNPATGLEWNFINPFEIDQTEMLIQNLGVGEGEIVTQLMQEVVFDTTGFPAPTATSTATRTPTRTFTTTRTPTPTATNTRTPTATSSRTPTPSFTPTDTPTDTPTPTFTPTHTATSTDTPTLTRTPTRTFSPTPTETDTPTFTPTVTLTPSPTPSVTTTPTDTRTFTRTATPSETPTATHTGSPAPTSTHTLTPTVTLTLTATATPSVTRTPTTTRTPTDTFVPSPTATLPGPDLRDIDNMNGFEAGLVGDYLLGAGNPAQTNMARSGQFALRTNNQASQTTAQYVFFNASAASETFTDGIWACRQSTSLSGARRIRTWSGSGASNAVGMILNPDFTVTVEVGGLGVGTSQTPIAVCGASAPFNFTHYELQFGSLGVGGFVTLRINGGVEIDAPHASAATINSGRIGFDQQGASLDVIWDDHTFARTLTWPEDLRIVGLLPTSDGFYVGWGPGTTNCGLGGYTCVDQAPPTDTAYLQTNIGNLPVSFCHAPAIPAGIYGRILGVKHTAVVRKASLTTDRLRAFTRVGSEPCEAHSVTATRFDDPDTFESTLQIRGFGWTLETNPITSLPWTLSEIDRIELGVVHISGNSLGQLFQVMLEVAFDTRGAQPPTPTPTVTSTPSPTPTGPTPTRTFTETGTPTETPIPTLTFTVTSTATASRTGTPTITITATGTATPLPSVTATDVPTATPSATETEVDTPTETPTRTRTATRTATVSPTATETDPPTPTGTVTQTVTGTLPDTQTPTRTPTVTRTPTQTATPSPTDLPPSTATNTPTPLETATATATETIGSPTATPTITSTPTETGTPTITPTVTQTKTVAPTPLIDYLMPRGPAAQACISRVAEGLSERVEEAPTFFNPLFSDFANDDRFADVDSLRMRYRAIFIGPRLSDADYTNLIKVSKTGGRLEQFAAQGGSVIINVAGTRGDQLDIAPVTVDYTADGTHNFETLMNTAHPYFTGQGYGGLPLTQSNFTGWGPVDRGRLVSIPSETVLLRNTDGVSFIEYPYGDGRVIVTTLDFCGSDNENGPDRRAIENLLLYGRFYQGSAQTPAPTVTSTPTATNTPVPPTGTPTPTPTVTLTPTITLTPSPTPSILRGDANLDGEVNSLDLATLIRLLFEHSGESVSASDVPPEADVDGDDRLTAADVLALEQILGR